MAPLTFLEPRGTGLHAATPTWPELACQVKLLCHSKPPPERTVNKVASVLCLALGWRQHKGVRQTLPSWGPCQPAWTVHLRRYVVVFPQGGGRTVYQALLQNHLPYSHILDLVVFISLFCDCHSFHVSTVCHMLLALHPFFLTTQQPCWHCYPRFPESETEVSARVACASSV